MEGRDTQFLGFARALLNDLPPEDSFDQTRCNDIQKIIARRAYDLVAHVLSQVPLLIQISESMQPRPQTVEDIIVHVPDMTELPEVSE